MVNRETGKRRWLGSDADRQTNGQTEAQTNRIKEKNCLISSLPTLHSVNLIKLRKGPVIIPKRSQYICLYSETITIKMMSPFNMSDH